MLVVVIVVVSTSARPNRASRVAAAEEEDDARARSMTATSEERLSSLRSSKESGKEFFFFARSRKNEKSVNTSFQSFQSPHSTLALSLFSLACWSSSGARDLRVHLSAASPSLHLSRACTCSVSLPHDAPRRLRAKSLISFFFRQANTK
jgi:hypothetical protein